MITIIGGGASGTALATNLLRWAGAPVSISLLESSESRLNRGVAYSTDESVHRLNVPAAKMSMFPSEPAHFLEWARANAGGEVNPTDFLPRPVYGRYLRSSLQDAEASAVPGVSLQRVAGQAVDVSGAGEVYLNSGIAIRGDQVVLALGNQPPSDLGLSAYLGESHFTPDPWDGALHYLDAQGPVFLIGTGLTMVDVALSYFAKGHDAPIHAFSRHGLLPQSHAVGAATGYSPSPAFSDFLESARGWTPENTSQDVLRIVKTVRAEVRVAKEAGHDWRAVFDALRPVTQNLWRSLDDGQKRVFLELFRRYWDVHRHRISPESSKVLQEAIRDGRLILHRGSDLSFVVGPGGLRARWNGVAGDVPLPRDVAVSRAVNCTGPSARYDRSSNPLLRRLFASGSIRPGPAGLGLDALPDGTIFGEKGHASSVLTTLGPPLAGVLWESTAMPEIRVQAETLAKRLLQRLDVPLRDREAR